MITDPRKRVAKKRFAIVVRDLEYGSREKVSHIKQHDARVPMFRPNNKRPLGFPAAAAFPLARARRPSAGATFALLLPSWESWG